MTQPTQLDRIESKLDQLLARTPAPDPTPTPSPTPSSARYPADIFGTGWKLTLPINGAQEIKQPALATYSSKYCELTSAGDGAVFRAYHGGDTTSGSSNPRSELRETYNGDPEGYWQIEKGSHALRIVGQVNRLTKVKPEVVLEQLHDKDDDLVVWRLEANKLWLTDHDNTHAYLADANYVLGTPYELTMSFAAGLASFAYNGALLPYTKKLKGKGYFKGGNYLQSNPKTAPTESTSEYSEVVIRSITVSHAA